jgi:hypothetical protein
VVFADLVSGAANQLLGLDEDGFDKSGVWRGGQFPLLDLSGELEWERWAEQQSTP